MKWSGNDGKFELRALTWQRLQGALGAAVCAALKALDLLDSFKEGFGPQRIVFGAGSWVHGPISRFHAVARLKFRVFAGRRCAAHMEWELRSLKCVAVFLILAEFYHWVP